VSVAGMALLPWFLIMRVCGAPGFGRACGVQGLMKKEEENKSVYLPLLHVQGKEKEEQCRSKRHCSSLSLSVSLC